jgi:hypothetical protein
MKYMQSNPIGQYIAVFDISKHGHRPLVQNNTYPRVQLVNLDPRARDALPGLHSPLVPTLKLQEWLLKSSHRELEPYPSGRVHRTDLILCGPQSLV